MALTPSSMQPNQYIIVKLTPDMKNYTAWVVDSAQELVFGADGLPAEPVQAVSNRTTSSSTLGTNVGGALPTLST